MTEVPASTRLKTYSDHRYVHTTLVRHQGTTVALALDEDRRLFYTVLNLDVLSVPQDGAGGGRSELDVDFWSENPKELPFPSEIARAGFASVGATVLPRVQVGGRREAGREAGRELVLTEDEVDPFLSSTARLTAAVPFQVVSDGKHLFVFRQAVGADHADALFRLGDRSSTGDRTNAELVAEAARTKRAVAADRLLCDRFVLAGDELKRVQEVRYRRSRHRTSPASAKDSLGNADMDGRPFFEPTLELGFAGVMAEGRFAVLLVPTAVAGTRRWQFFLSDPSGERIGAVNVEQGGDGLFHTEGSRFYTSPDPKHRGDVLERVPGTCPFTKKPLVPVEPDRRFAETALALLPAADGGLPGFLEVPSGVAKLGLGTGPYTIEAWVRPDALGARLVHIQGVLSLSLNSAGALAMGHVAADAAGQRLLSGVDSGRRTVQVGRYTHVAAVFDGKKASLYLDGQLVASRAIAPAAVGGDRMLIGATAGEASGAVLTGVLDEVRIWRRARTAEQIAADFGFRLVGDEPGLAAYYRFDEGTGSTASDQSAGALDATVRGTTAWVTSEAPVADHPGIRREYFQVAGRKVAGGLSAALHHQQEQAAVGHDGTKRLLKRQARVMLAWAAAESAAGTGAKSPRIAALDLAVARDGRLAQLPDRLNLPLVGANIDTVDAAEANRLREEIPKLKEQADAADAELLSITVDDSDPRKVHTDFRRAVEAGRSSAVIPLKDGQATGCFVFVETGGSHFSVRSSFWHLAVTQDASGSNKLEVVDGYPGAADEGAHWEVVRVGDAPGASAPSSAAKDASATDVSATDVSGPSGDRATEVHFGSYRPYGATSELKLRNAKTKQVLSFRGKQVALGADGGFSLAYAPGSGSLSGGGNEVFWDGGQLVLADRFIGDRSVVPVSISAVAVTPSGAEGTKALAGIAEGFRHTHALRTTRTTAYRNTRTQEAQRLRDRIAAKEERLGWITGGTEGRSDLTQPMVHLGRDRCGLGFSGALLAFAPVTGTPFLTDSGTGHLGLYFRDDKQRLTSLFYETTVGRSAKTLAGGEGTAVYLSARDAALDLATVSVTVTAEDTGLFAGRCTLTLVTGDGEREEWSLLPRAAAKLTEVLNGQWDKPAPVGTVKSFKDGVLTLTAGARRAVAAGDLLDVGGLVYVLTEAAAAKATELRVNHGDAAAEIAAGTPVRLVSYHPSLVTHTRPGSSAAFGSRLVTATLAAPAATLVADGTGQDSGAARPPRWWGALPGRALLFEAGTRPPALPADLLRSVRHTDDLTLEAWLQPRAGGVARIVHANVPALGRLPESQYTLALGAADADGRRPLIAGVGGRFVRSAGTVPAGEAWTHAAAAFEQSWALEFDGRKAWAQCPPAEDLNISQDLTLEVFLRRPATATAGDQERPGEEQGLLSKGRIGDGSGKQVPYQLSLAEDGKIVFAFEDTPGTTTRVVSTGAVQPGAFTRIAVVRKVSTSRKDTTANTALAGLGDSKAEGTDDVKKIIEMLKSVVLEPAGLVSVQKQTDITFYIGNEQAGHTRLDSAPELGHPGALEIGRAPQADSDRPFQGVISEIRIWNTPKPTGTLGADLPRTRTRPVGAGAVVPVRQEGLVAHWRFEENEGNTARDENGTHPVQLHGAGWVKNPDPAGSAFRLYLNGRPTQTAPLPAADAPDAGSYGDAQFALGGRATAAGGDGRYQGVLEEVRVWRTARSEEQLLDNLFTRLNGDKGDLLAYYSFDDDSTASGATALLDQGPRGCHLPLPTEAAQRPTPVMSQAPISPDTPEVRSAFATGQPLFIQTATAGPAASEYADLQTLRDGSTRGVLKRCYTYVQDGRWQLVTGYKLGDLTSEWVGQVQFAPQLIGYIEGAPPVPSENLVATRRPGSLSYLNTTSVEFKQADQVVQSLSSSSETSIDAALEYSAGAEFDFGTHMITAPFGVGISVPVADVKLGLKTGASLEYSNAWGSQTEVSEGVNTTRSTLVGLGGGWESETAKIDKNGALRFQPTNIGFALVQSETADVFALRLEHSGAVVSYRMTPNPDIPRDWNLIPFNINPRYVKQGTLDGTVGFQEAVLDAEGKVVTPAGKIPDPHYPDAAQRGDWSYFKPREAYALKRRIIQDQQRRQAYYENVSTETHHADPTIDRARALLSSFVGPVRGVDDHKPDTSKQVDAFARRDIVNTYVWSADGGFFAETTDTTDVVTETTSGSYTFTGSATAGASLDFTIGGVGFGLNLDASLGGSMSRTRARSREATRSFSLDVHVDTPGDMQKYDESKDFKPLFHKDGSPDEAAGRVDAYRFMTFYLDSDKANFEDFYGKVIDPQWLDGPSANAAALRQAQQAEHKPPCWRVLHRVTFVSRKLPDTLPAGADPLDKALVEADISSNYELVRQLEPYVSRAAVGTGDLALQVKEALEAHLPDLTDHAKEITGFFADYYGIK
ncbi:LamG domain-containing protein [Streptomyces subrutilus]|uniref:LamG domain-containing protein n=1 Tax=Streptomyces subrutilus TaxID=36818 RepID=UPI0033D02C16